MNSINKTARIAGLLYLTLVPLGFFQMYVSSASESLVRLGIVSALLVQIINLFVVLTLYRLLKPVNKNMARLMVTFILLGVPIAMFNELNRFAILFLSHGADYPTVRSLAPLFLDLHDMGIHIAGIFWGLWLFPMGYLVFKSGFLPRILGILLMIGCFGYLIDSFAVFLLPNSAVNIALFTFWGEVLLPLWLLIKGVNVEQWKKRALESAGNPIQ